MADTTPKAHLAARAIEKTLEQCSFGAVKLLTDKPNLPYAVPIKPLIGLEAYSKFCIRELAKHVNTPHCLLIQSDGYVLNGAAWKDDFLKYDYVASPWLPSKVVGNGGFSLRSKKLLDACASLSTTDNEHPEDNWISLRHRTELEMAGCRFADYGVAKDFAFEGRSWNGNGREWEGVPTRWENQFGFHSWLTRVPKRMDTPHIWHHSGDWGDLIYAMPVMKALGGGVLFMSADCKFPFPMPPRSIRSPSMPFADWCNQISPLLEAQDYVWSAKFTHATPFSTDYDLNRFRLPWARRSSSDLHSIFRLHADAFHLTLDESQPWLMVDKFVSLPNKPIVVNRTERYQNLSLQWTDCIRKYGDQMVFIGSPKEHELFNGLGAPFKKVDYHPTKNFLEAARIIAGAKVFMGNQSSCMAIALGLGVPVVQEVWPMNGNCRLKRANAMYVESGKMDVPKGWL